MAPALSWRKKAASSAVPSTILQACALNLVLPQPSELESDHSQDGKGLLTEERCSRAHAYSAASTVSTASSDNGGTSDLESSPPPSPVIRPISWSAALQARREARTDGNADDAEVMRRVKALLNKLTVEKFDALSQQLLSCGISSTNHLGLLVEEISEKACMQPHFAKMYTDLCERLGDVLGEDAQGHDLSDVLLIHSQKWFDMLLQLPSEDAQDTEGELEETQAQDKARLLGNIRFTGELILRGIISSKTILVWCQDLLQEPLAPTCLEALAIFLGIVGSRFDSPANPIHRQFRQVFWQIRGITYDMNVPARIRYLIKDVLDQKDAGWVDVRASVRPEAPKRLSEVHQNASQNSPHGCAWQHHGFVFSPSNLSPMAAEFTPSFAMATHSMVPMNAPTPRMATPQQPAVTSLPPPASAAQPPVAKKKGFKLQNKSLAKPVSND